MENRSNDVESGFPGPGAQEQGRPGIVVVSVAVVVMAAFIGLLAYSLLTRETMPMDTTTRTSIAAPSFTLSQLNGAGDVSLSDFEGSPLVVNFWASWCAPCRVEMPHLVEAHERYKGQGVRFIGVAIQDTNEDALAFIEEFTVPVDDGYVMVTDPDGEATIDYGVGGLPVTFFIESDGRVHTRWAGVVNGAVLDERIAEILS
ncbi:MAG: TlpA family protein disulfide reductase [Dehalococcoidia bacterium]|nr:TlpA family protein disulfide reductase [Dehalococcoidia bacterium]